MRVEMIACTNVDPEELASHAAKMCYSADVPEMGDTLDVEALFEKGHHTTLEHFSMTFMIDGISVGDVDFGLHGTTPFYNTCQRSGRYARMFDNPDVSEAIDYILRHYSDTDPAVVAEIGDYLEKGLSIFAREMVPATEVCQNFLMHDRPNLTTAMMKNANKLAQEQMRCFIPVIVPTGLDYTIDLVTLSGLYHTAWSPVMRAVTSAMAVEVLRAYPGVAFLFGERRSKMGEWAPELPEASVKLVRNAKLKLLEIVDGGSFSVPERQDKFPIDQTTTSPHFADNEVGVYRAEVDVPLDLLGQDQRHRTNRRSAPNFTGQFCLPPIAAELGLHKEAREMMRIWMGFKGRVHPMLLATLAPYGAVVHYVKQGHLGAFVHEGGKRLCCLAQWCIRQMNFQLRRQLARKKEWRKYLPLYQAPCHDGPCVEPDRICGRDMTDKKRYYSDVHCRV